MKYTHIADGYALRIDKDEQLKESILRFIDEVGISSAWITGLGGFQSVELGFYDLAEKTYRWTKIEQNVELTGLQGNVALLEGKPQLHLHGTISTETCQAMAGHINEAVIAGTCELHVIVFSPGSLKRTLDNGTGLNSLEL
jgi:uncharacterized protein